MGRQRILLHCQPPAPTVEDAGGGVGLLAGVGHAHHHHAADTLAQVVHHALLGDPYLRRQCEGGGGGAAVLSSAALLTARCQVRPSAHLAAHRQAHWAGVAAGLGPRAIAIGQQIEVLGEDVRVHGAHTVRSHACGGSGRGADAA